MPHANVWIRKEDWEKWNLITNKSELISQAINRSLIEPVETADGIKTVQTIEPDIKPVRKAPAKSKKECKHGNPKGFCFDKQKDRSCEL